MALIRFVLFIVGLHLFIITFKSLSCPFCEGQITQESPPFFVDETAQSPMPED